MVKWTDFGKDNFIEENDIMAYVKDPLGTPLNRTVDASFVKGFQVIYKPSDTVIDGY